MEHGDWMRSEFVLCLHRIFRCSSEAVLGRILSPKKREGCLHGEVPEMGKGDRVLSQWTKAAPSLGISPKAFLKKLL